MTLACPNCGHRFSERGGREQAQQAAERQDYVTALLREKGIYETRLAATPTADNAARDGLARNIATIDEQLASLGHTAAPHAKRAERRAQVR